MKEKLSPNSCVYCTAYRRKDDAFLKRTEDWCDKLEFEVDIIDDSPCPDFELKQHQTEIDLKPFKEIRDQIIEAAAMICDGRANAHRLGSTEQREAWKCAAMIRSLKDVPPTPEKP